MLDADDPKRPQDNDQEQFSPCNRSTHVEVDSLTAHFNELLSMMSTEVMESLLTAQQKNTMKSIEEAFSGGARSTKQIRRELYEWILRIDHRKQVEDKLFYQKNAKLNQKKTEPCS
jgi:predicted lipoprotein